MAGAGEAVRFGAADPVDYATALFAAAGLVEADLLGHTTHGLQLAPAYLRELGSGA
jgi:LDH2 family malate/lactate/ureidoglycolate dehydrogenase